MVVPPANLRQTCIFGNCSVCNSSATPYWKFSKEHADRHIHVAFKIPYVYGFITKLCRQQAEAIQNQVNENVSNIGQCEAQHSEYKRLKLRGARAYNPSND
jgi:hypothetical protein